MFVEPILYDKTINKKVNRIRYILLELLDQDFHADVRRFYIREHHRTIGCQSFRILDLAEHLKAIVLQHTLRKQPGRFTFHILRAGIARSLVGMHQQFVRQPASAIRATHRPDAELENLVAAQACKQIQANVLLAQHAKNANGAVVGYVGQFGEALLRVAGPGNAAEPDASDLEIFWTLFSFEPLIYLNALRT